MNFKAAAFVITLLLGFQCGAVEIDVNALVTKINANKFPHYATKRSVEVVATNLWRSLVTMSNFDTLPEKYKMTAVFVKLALDALDRKEDPNDPDVIRVNKLTAELNRYALDKNMRGCFKVYFIEDKNFDNAFTTTCHIFMTRSLPAQLNDNELRAVIAHEMGHGALGHFTKTYKKLLTTLGTNTLRLPIEEVFWLVDGQFKGRMGFIHELYAEAYTSGETQFYNSTSYRPELWQDKFFQWFDATSAGVSAGFDALMNQTLKEYGSSQDKVELEADVAATVLLKRMGYSGEDLISALMKLENINSESDIKPLPSTNVHTPREYPSLYYRIQAIRSTQNSFR